MAPRALTLVVVLLSCTPAPADQPTSTAQPTLDSTKTAAPVASTAPDPSDCGALGCRLYDSPEQAFSALLADKPQVVAVGEAHAQKGTEDVASATARFRQQLLPLLRNKASDVVLELMVADGSCKVTQERVAKVQKPVVEQQAKSNKNEFVLLGEESEKLGIRPHVLTPSCDDYKAVLAAGDDGVARMLTMIADLSADLVSRILDRNAKNGADKLVLAYGGALHNDLAPPKEREAWSFGPRLRERTHDRYIELDLIVPEFIKDTDSWRAMAWYPHYDKNKYANKVVLFHPAPRSYVLIFASTAKP